MPCSPRILPINRTRDTLEGFHSICPKASKASKEKPADDSVTVCRVAEWKSDRATYPARCNDLPRSRTRRGKASRGLCRLLTECVRAQTPGRGLPLVSILLLSFFPLLFFLQFLPSSTLLLSPPFLPRLFSPRSRISISLSLSLNFLPLEKVRGGGIWLLFEIIVSNFSTG